MSAYALPNGCAAFTWCPYDINRGFLRYGNAAGSHDKSPTLRTCWKLILLIAFECSWDDFADRLRALSAAAAGQSLGGRLRSRCEWQQHPVHNHCDDQW